MNKIALTTKYSAHNFGAVLQTYALQKTINDMGGDCFVVDADRKKVNLLSPWNSPSQIVSNIFYYMHKKDLDEGHRRFEAFIDTLPLSKRYEDYDQLLADPPEADVYLTGSDQVWHPLDVRENYFLRYAPAGKIRASYAASMGISYMTMGAKRIWKEFLADIDYISVRENTTKQIIEDIDGRSPYVHVDPTLLLSAEEWESIAKKPDYNKPYIFCYILYRPPWLNKWLKELHRKTKKEIVVISSDAYRNIYHTKMVRDAGPQEMLGWLKNADFVISSSFHGVALSVANKIPFYAVVNPDAPARISDLLELFGLQDRMISADHSFDLEPVNYDKVQNIQSKCQKASFEYLQFLIDKPDKPSQEENKRTAEKHLDGNIEIVGKKCTGCTVCANICPTEAIQMIRNDEGFIYPFVNGERCVCCGKCLNYCHTLK